jgi:hemerythrin
MALPHWNASLELGVPEIDNDHRHLVELVRRLTELNQASVDRDDVWAVLVDLEDYTHQHFAREERLMDDTGHEFAARHKEEHEKMKLDVRNVLEDFLAGSASVSSILIFLERWLLTHIAGSDTLLAHSVIGTRTGNPD